MTMIKRFTYEAMRMLPPGSVTARGWIREQLLRAKDGMSGHLDELEPEMIATPYTTSQTRDDLGRSIQAGWGAEQSGNYWYGLIQLAFALNDSDLIAKAEKWVNETLANQYDNGYLGPYTDKDNRMDDFNGFGTGSGLNALQAFYEATGREDVLNALHRSLLWYCENWAGDKKTRYCGQALVFNMAWCYRYTADERLAKFIEEYFDFLNRNDVCGNSINAMRSPELFYTSIHAAALALLPKYAAAGYMTLGEDEYLDAALNLLKKIRRKLLLPTGGIASNTEYISPVTANTETEYCTFSFFQNALIWLGAVSADASCYDIVERIAFNGAQGARKKDERAIAYFTSPNQLFATSKSDFMGDDMGVYAPCYPTACCSVSSTWIMPDYLYGMALTDKENNAYIAAYGPANINLGDFILESDTLFPFDEEVRYVVRNDAKTQIRKTVYVRIPGWCKNASVMRNGEKIDGDINPGSFFAVNSTWQDGDELVLHFPMQLVVRHLDDGDSWRHYPVTVEYGPLVFSLPVPEIWSPAKETPRTPLPEGWHWYEVSPKFVNDMSGDVYEKMLLQRYTTSWNIAVDEDIDASAIQVVRRELKEGEYVWENPPLSLSLDGFHAPYSYAPYIRKTHVVYQSPAYVTEPRRLTLVPYGCTNLRITCLPRAKI